MPSSALNLNNYLFSILRLIRLPNLLILTFAQVFTFIFLTKHSTSSIYILNKELMLLVFCTFCIAAGGYAINDYYDVKIDIINKPGKLIVGRTLSRRHSMVIHIIFTCLGIFFSGMLGELFFLINVLAAFSLWIYSNSLKRLPFIGNFVVAFLSGLAVYLVVFTETHNYDTILAYAFFAFLISLIREIIKDMEDLQGDKKFGCTTLPIKYGLRNSKKIIYLIEIVFVGSIVMLLIEAGTTLSLKLYIMLLLALIGYFSFHLHKADTKKDYTFLSGICKLIMICGIVSMIFI